MDHYLTVILAILFSAFFSGMEIAFVSSNKLKFELEKKQNKAFSNLLNVFYRHPSQYISTMLVGNNIALVIYGIFTAIILDPYIEAYVSNEGLLLLIETLISTFVILILAEFLPKTIFRILPNFFLNLFSLPVIFFYIILFPIAKFSIWVSDLFLKIVAPKHNGKDEVSVYRKVDIDSLFLSEKEKENIGIDGNEIDVELFQNALDFSDIKLRDCMVPRTEIVAIDINESIEKLTQLFIETGFSKILIYKDNIDNIVGYTHTLDIFNNPKNIKNIILKITIAPESMTAEKLLSKLTSENKSLAVVVDEFGGTAGIVTIEDIIEEIFGEIEDEFDKENDLEVQIKENEFQFSARLEIDYLNKKYQLDLPESDEYETLAGLILSHHNNIPKLNETIEIDQFTFTITEVNFTRIDSVYVSLKDF